jgi:hypothetical protein
MVIMIEGYSLKADHVNLGREKTQIDAIKNMQQILM